MNGVLLNGLKSAAQTFDEEGVLFYPQVFEGEELERLRIASEYILEQFLSDVDKNSPEMNNVISMRHLIDPRWHKGDKTHWKTLMEVVADPRCLGPVEQIFRGESLFYTTSLFFNPRFESYEGNWHRDTQFTLPDEDHVKANISQKESMGIQFQIALVDNDDLEYVPYSPNRYDSPEEYQIRCADGYSHNREGGMPNAMRFQQRAGDAAIFNPRGLHRGRYYVHNSRRTLMLTYTPRDLKVNSYFSLQPWMMEEGALSDLSPRATAYFSDFANTYRDFWLDEEASRAAAAQG